MAWRVSFNCDFLENMQHFPLKNLPIAHKKSSIIFKNCFLVVVAHNAKLGWHPCSGLVPCILAVMIVQQVQGAVGISVCMAGQHVHAH